MVDNVIRLFESDAITYNTNGLGYMDDCLSCIVTEERNGMFELKMEYPIIGKRSGDLQLNRIIVANSNPYQDYAPQAFRIYSISKPMNGKIQIDAQHISYDLNGIVCLPISITLDQISVNAILNKLFNTDPRYTIPTIPSEETAKWNHQVPHDVLVYGRSFSVKKPTNLKGVLGGSEGSIIQVFEKGEWEFNNYKIIFHTLANNYTGRGKNRGVTVRYGKNLQDLTQDENIANMYDGVLGYWYNEESDPSLVRMDEPKWRDPENPGKKVLALDLTDKFETAPSDANLRTAVNNYINNNQVFKPEISIRVTMAVLDEHPEFENVRLCDTVNVYFEQYGINADAKVIKTVYDCKKGRYQSLELGNAIRDLSDSLSK